MTDSPADCPGESPAASPAAGADPHVVDARGRRCPLPVIMLGRAARDLGPGAVVRLLATDPAAGSDVPAFCRMRGHELVSTAPWPSGDGADEPDGADEVATAYVVRVSATGPAGAR